MSSTLTLSLGTLSLTLGVPGQTPFADGNYPREQINGPSFTRSVAGAIAQEGSFFEPPHTWSINAYLLPTDAEILDKMYALFVGQKPFQWLTVADKIRLFNEVGSARTRPLAPDAMATVADGLVSYYAQFNAYFVDAPKFVREGKRVRVACQLMEAEKLSAS